jgi:anti-sigma factor RsiW
MLVIERIQEPARPERAHLAPHELDGFLRGELDPADCRRVVRHLLTECRTCQAVAQALWRSNRTLIPVPWPRAMRPRP